MSIEAAVAFLTRASGRSEGEGNGPGAIAARAERARAEGFVLDADELRRAIAARELLRRLERGDDERASLTRASEPVASCLSQARGSGLEVDEAALRAWLQELRRRCDGANGAPTDQSELSDESLDAVAGGRGALVLPELDDEVLVAFARGELRQPIVLGSLWNGGDGPPRD